MAERQVEAYDVMPHLRYVAAHHHGPLFQGLCGPSFFVDGIAAEPVTGFEARSKGLLTCCYLFEYVEGHTFTWDQDGKPVYAAPAKPKPPPKPDPPRRRRGARRRASDKG
jgi:hypothetical protein